MLFSKLKSSLPSNFLGCRMRGGVFCFVVFVRIFPSIISMSVCVDSIIPNVYITLNCQLFVSLICFCYVSVSSVIWLLCYAIYFHFLLYYEESVHLTRGIYMFHLSLNYFVYMFDIFTWCWSSFSIEYFHTFFRTEIHSDIFTKCFGLYSSIFHGLARLLHKVWHRLLIIGGWFWSGSFVCSMGLRTAIVSREVRKYNKPYIQLA